MLKVRVSGIAYCGLIAFYSLIIFCLGYLTYPRVNMLRIAAVESAAKKMAVIYVAPLESRMAEFGNYIKGPELPSSPALYDKSSYFYYVSLDSVPERYRRFLPKGVEPSIEKSTYRILMVIENNYSDRASFWIIQPKAQIERLPVEVPLHMGPS